MVNKITQSIKKFNLNLQSKNVLTEAATGNYVVTPVIAAIAGANVYAITRDSRFGTVEDVKKETYALAKKFNVEDKIHVIENIDEVNLSEVNILTNTGFVRPINESIVKKLSPECVVPLMWEPWEYRSEDLDLEACNNKGIKVYGTNESDPKLMTMSYIGYMVLFFLLDNKHLPMSSNILLLANEKFAKPIQETLNNNNYQHTHVTDYSKEIDVDDYNIIIVSEHSNDQLLIGEKAFIQKEQIKEEQLIIHICGNVDITGVKARLVPEKPAKFGYMSFTTDYIDNQAVIDLHTAGLKVAEGMLALNQKNLDAVEYKKIMEKDYLGLSFEDKKYW